jgi:hypothetical protein
VEAHSRPIAYGYFLEPGSASVVANGPGDYSIEVPLHGRDRMQSSVIISQRDSRFSAVRERRVRGLGHKDVAVIGPDLPQARALLESRAGRCRQPASPSA